MKIRRQQRGVLNHSPAGAPAGGGHWEEEQGNTHCHSAARAICACTGSLEGGYRQKNPAAFICGIKTPHLRAETLDC